jgi:hypothetical protein
MEFEFADRFFYGFGCDPVTYIDPEQNKDRDEIR